MKRFWKRLSVILLAFVLSGCRNSKNFSPVVVDRVQIQGWHGEEMISRSYVEEGQIQGVLNCLRLYRNRGIAQTDPERIVSDVYVIRVHLSDGTQQIYRHRGGKYLSKNSRPWCRVDPQQMEALYSIVWKIE